MSTTPLNLHPAREAYLKGMPDLTLERLFHLLDSFDSKMRDRALGWAYMNVINPEMREPVSVREKHGDLMEDYISYPRFKLIIKQPFMPVLFMKDYSWRE